MLVFRGPQRLSYYDADGEFVIDCVEAGSDRWRAAWSAFLEAFGAHLDERGWRDQTFLAFDERPADLMEAALDVIDETAPDFQNRIRVAGSADAEPFTADLGVHYNYLPLDEDVLAARRETGEITTFYATPPARHPRTLCYSPAVEARLFPWIAAANDLNGVLRWAYNSWPANVFANPIFRYPQGAEYLVYPGDDGPISSIRWELLREGIGEYELARRARDVGDIEDAIALGARDHDGREKDLSDITEARRRLFEALAGQ